jgi:hypothetical protein
MSVEHLACSVISVSIGDRSSVLTPLFLTSFS